MAQFVGCFYAVTVTHSRYFINNSIINTQKRLKWPEVWAGSHDKSWLNAQKGLLQYLLLVDETPHSHLLKEKAIIQRSERRLIIFIPSYWNLDSFKWTGVWAACEIVFIFRCFFCPFIWSSWRWNPLRPLKYLYNKMLQESLLKEEELTQTCSYLGV